MRALPRLALRRLQAQPAAEARTIDPQAACGRIRQQLAFVLDAARFKVACCSRRAGKTRACAIILLLRALARADSNCLYITLSRVSGKRIVWKTLLKYNRDFALGGVSNLSDLTLTFPNGSVITVDGAKDESVIERRRGEFFDIIVIDEAQSFPAYIEQLIDDILEPTLIERKGALVLIGTPGKVRSGYFYESLRRAPPEILERLHVEPANDNAGGDDESEAVVHEWSVHHWTIHDNAYIDDVDDELARIRRRKRWSTDHPTYQREYLGRWVTEHEALVYKYDAQRNGYDPSGMQWDAPDWVFVHFVDQGFDDADACGTIALRVSEPWIWLLPDEDVIRRQGSAALVNLAVTRWARYKGRSVAFVWDTGGGGKKTAADASMAGVPVEAAEKSEKVAAIDGCNDLLLTGALKIPLNSQAAADAARVTWDPKARGVKVGGRWHTDIWDGIVYALRRAPKVISLEDYKRKLEERKAPGAAELGEREERTRRRVQMMEMQKKRNRGARGLLR